MVRVILGEKGKGKTKILLDKVNADVANAKGSIVYLDKNAKHMFELGKEVRLINVGDYFIESSEEFTGFLLGIISQNHDIERVYLDSFLTISCNDKTKLGDTLAKLDKISANFNVDFVLSVSLASNDFPEELKSYIDIAL